MQMSLVPACWEMLGYRITSPKPGAALSEKAGVTAEMVIGELAKIGFADIRKAMKWGATVIVLGVDRDGNEIEEAHTPMALIPSDEIDDATAAAIAEVSIGKDGQMKLKMHDKRAALVDLGRHLGMFETEKAPEAKGLEVVFNQFNVSVEDSRATFRKLARAWPLARICHRRVRARCAGTST